MRVAVLGGTGFIGRHLVRLLLSEGCRVTVVSRRAYVEDANNSNVDLSYFTWNGTSADDLIPLVECSDAVVNLIGEGIADKRWTEERKVSLLSSRVSSASALCRAVIAAKRKPEVVVQASAVGYYGYRYDRKDKIETDEFSECGEGFLADLCKRWEDAILPVESHVKRLVVLRTGIVLGRDGGIIAKLLPLFRLGLGTSVGKGTQPFSWIHIDDETGAISYLLSNSEAKGVYNLVAPNQCTYRFFVDTLGRAVHRPVLMAVPVGVVRLAFGREMADEAFLGGKVVVPHRLLESGYIFKHPYIEETLQAIVDTL